MRRAIWSLAFLTGCYFLTIFLQQVDAWSQAAAVPGAEMYCQRSVLASYNPARVPMCTALIVQEAKSWLFFLRDIVLSARFDTGWAMLLRAGDVLIFTVGGIALAATLAMLWANLLLRILETTVEGIRSLLYAMRPSLWASGR